MSTGDRRYDRSSAYRSETTPLESLTRYDLVLLGIPVAFVLTVAVSGLFDVPLRTALLGGAFVGMLGVLDTLFLNPPTGGRRTV
ncbi:MULTISPECIES: hypothetical protein [Haloarcula]|uniref:hypothetical protein n=1 Tax=Haloarcula TaxID=2237 RepID=UPI0023EDDF40|nr:hypothetical protein [Halomicroarcula sp. XH51]